MVSTKENAAAALAFWRISQYLVPRFVTVDQNLAGPQPNMAAPSEHVFFIVWFRLRRSSQI
jgi:hypothetical protein